MRALPSLLARVGNSAVLDPAGTVTLPGTSTLGLLLPRGTTVGSDCVGAIVTVRMPAFPLGRVRVGGVMRPTVGGSWFTVTALWAEVPFKGPTVRMALPGERPVIVIVVVREPAGTVTEDGRPRTEDGLALTGMTVSVSWAALIVRVRVAVAPT
jgi:hypothetical protein